MSACDRLRPALAAYTFGALAETERAEVARHLETCPACQAEWRELARLPELLDLAGSTEVAIASPPPLLEASVLAHLPLPAQRERHPRPRRRPRWQMAGALALSAALGATLVLVISLLAAGPASVAHPMRVALRPTPQAPAARAVAMFTRRPWGTQIQLLADDLAPTGDGQVYEVWLVCRRGRLSAGTFTVPPGRRHVTVTLAAGVHPGQVWSIGVTVHRAGAPARGPEILGAPMPASGDLRLSFRAGINPVGNGMV